MEIGERRYGDILVLRPVGRIDNLTSAKFQARLLGAAASASEDIVIDLAAVDYISSAGLRALMVASRTKPRELRLAVASLNAVVQEIFEISRFSQIIPIFATVEEAVAAWERAPRARQTDAAAETGPSELLRVHFWGTRGSLPAPLRESAVRAKIYDALAAAQGQALDTPDAINAFIDRKLPFSVRGTFGGNTSCVEIITGGDEFVLCDLGTGVREFGNHVLAAYGPARKNTYNIFLSHPHWDHIMGFPFFTPASIPGNVVRVYGGHQVLREALENQQMAPFFPVDFRSLGATIEFVTLEPGRSYDVAGLSVTALKQFHGGDSYAYRFFRGGKTIVYSTDCEHRDSILDESYPFVGFCRNADLLIFDAMYSLADTMSVKEDWGHSNNVAAVELAQAARAKRLVLFHHEPVCDDRMIERVFAETVRLEEISRHGDKLEVIAAYDGLELSF